MNWMPRVPSFMLEKRRLNVLLVDHDINLLAPTVDMLQHYFLKVTSVKYASTGLSILSSGSSKIDVVMENIKSPDLCGFRLLQTALEKDLHVILLLDEDDYVLTKMAVEAGALVCITKPMTMGMAECLWQLVVGEKVRRFRRRSNLIIQQQQQQQQQLSMEAASYDMSVRDSATSDHQEIVSANNNSCKVWTEWTQELHDLFVDAVLTLREGRCYPKDILELMNVPGLTRMQVASHLQKCRSGTWLPPNKRKSKVAAASRDATRATSSRRFGSMPRLDQGHALHPTFQPNHNSNNVDCANVGHQTVNIDKVGLPDWGVAYPFYFPLNQQLLFDAHAPHAHTSPPLNQINGDHGCFDEFPSIDNMIGGFSLFDEAPVTYAVDDIDLVYSNQQVPVMNNADVDKWEEADINDEKSQVVIKKEAE